MFDDLSYSKAGSGLFFAIILRQTKYLKHCTLAPLVLRMLSHYVGKDKFLEGVSLYLMKRTSLARP